MIWTPEGLIAFSSLSITDINTFEGLVDLHVFIIKCMFLLVGRLLQSEKTKTLVKYLTSFSFRFHPYPLPSLFLYRLQLTHFEQRLVIKTLILSDRLCQRFFLTDQKLWLTSHHEILVCFLCATLFSLQKLSFSQHSHAFLEILKIMFM